MKKFLSIFFILCFLILWRENKVFGAIYVEVGDEIYKALNYLESIGCIKSAILTTLPLSQKEVFRLVFEAENTCGEDPYVKEIVSKIKKKLSYDPEVSSFKPIEKLELVGGGSSEEISSRLYNNDGDEFQKGYNLRLRMSTLFSGKHFSGFLKPEFKVDKDTTKGEIQKGYIVLSAHNFSLLLGKESQWWGPGRDGSIILSNNAEPFTMVRIENETPFVLPWIGLVKGVFFATKLDGDQKVANPYLWGMRINLKPSPYLEFGFSRTAILGGEGRKNNLKTWFNSFFSINENQDNPNSSEPGDQRAGFDIKVTVPNRYIPFQAYMEAEGEDEAGHFPYKWAYLVGLYLPKFPTLNNLSFQVEYARTNKYWYVHHIYGNKAYYYKGKVIGHHIGTKAKSIWGELEYRFPICKITSQLGLEFVKHELTKEDETRCYLKIKKNFSSHTSLNLFFQYSFLKNYKNINANKNFFLFSTTIIYKW